MKPFGLCFLLFFSVIAFGQDTPADSVTVVYSDSISVNKGGKIINIESYADRFNPRRAMLLAAVIPGAGQIYNKKYWKLPLVYGGFIGIGYGMNFYQQRYLFYKGKLFSILNEPVNLIVDSNGITPSGNKVIGGEIVTTEGYRKDQLRSVVNRNRRDRDFTVIMTFVWYMLQMVDAHVDAHLKEFDINPELKAVVEPSFQRNYLTGQSTGISLTFKF